MILGGSVRARVSAVLLAGFLVAGLSLPTAASAATVTVAEDDVSDQSPVDIIKDLAPEVLAETSSDNDVTVEETDSSAVGVSVPQSDVIPEGTSFTIDYASAVTEVSDGLTTLDTADADVSAVVQPTGYGVRVLTTVASSDAPQEYDYTFDVPPGTDLIESGLAYYLSSGDDLLGNLQLPWAVDADGNRVETTYTWADGTLTQHVDLSDPSITFPVVADPAWGYSYGYDMNKTAAQNKSKLKSCFNCYFPVSGAPRNFPAAGQILPLKVFNFNFECKFKKEMSGTDYFGWQFDATKNHIDGYGSNIIFELVKWGGKNKLIVSAYIVNDSWWWKSSLYRDGAKQNWQNFAANLNR